MPEHIPAGGKGRRDTSHGNNRNYIYKKADLYPEHVRKVPADSVPYGDSISRNGRTVWAAYSEDGVLVGVAATVGEARRKRRNYDLRKNQKS